MPLPARPARAQARRRARGPDPAPLPRRLVRPRAAALDRARATRTWSARCASYVRTIGEQLDEGRGLWFTGDVGTGKTTLAMLISKAAMEAGRTVAIYSLPRLLGELRDTYDDDAQHSPQRLIDRLSAPSTCCTSTTSAPSRRSPWVLEQLYAIVNTRYEEDKRDPRSRPTSSRSRRRALREQIGERTVSPPVRDVRRPEDDVRAGPAARDPLRAEPGARRRRAGRSRATASRARPGSASPRRLHAEMAGIVIIGAQWGDEGKGKITDLLAESADLVIRFQGGNNAGHTIFRDGRQVEVPPDPVRDPLPGQALRDRQRRRDRPEGADR